MQYTLVRSKRRTLALEVKEDGSLWVRAPFAVSEAEIQEFLARHQAWIQKAQKRQSEKAASPLTEREERELRARAVVELPLRTEKWAKKMGISYEGVKITSARYRLGSCNSRGGISYSFRLMQFPDEVIEYVVVHELSHRKEMNHSKAFYAVIEQYIPDYRERIKLLKSSKRAL